MSVSDYMPGFGQVLRRKLYGGAVETDASFQEHRDEYRNIVQNEDCVTVRITSDSDVTQFPMLTGEEAWLYACLAVEDAIGDMLDSDAHDYTVEHRTASRMGVETDYLRLEPDADLAIDTVEFIGEISDPYPV